MTDGGPETPRDGSREELRDRWRRAREEAEAAGDPTGRPDPGASVLAAFQREAGAAPSREPSPAEPPAEPPADPPADPPAEPPERSPHEAPAASAAREPPTPASSTPPGDAAVPETLEESRARLRREAAQREAAEQARLESEQKARKAEEKARRAEEKAGRAEARAADRGAEVARKARRKADRRTERETTEADRAERWRREQAEMARAATEQAEADKAARRAARTAAREKRRGRPEDPAPDGRIAPSPAEIAALAAPPPHPPAGRAPSPASRNDRRPYSERYAGEPTAAAPRGPLVMRSRSVLRRLVTTMLLLTLGMAAAFGFAAWREPTTATLGVAGACAGLALVLWAVRASSSPPRVVVDHGVVEITDGNERQRFDLTSRHTDVEMVGQPGRWGWEVRFKRQGRSPVVLTSSVVDPIRFAEALRRWRPDL